MDEITPRPSTKIESVNQVESIAEFYIFPVHLSCSFDLNRLVSSLSSSLLQKFNKDSAKSMFALSISKIMIHNLEHQHLSATMRCKLDAELEILRPKIGSLYRGQIQLDSSNEVYFVTIFDVFVIFLAHEDVLELKKRDVFLGDDITVVLKNLIVFSKELFGIGKPIDNGDNFDSYSEKSSQLLNDEQELKQHPTQFEETASPPPHSQQQQQQQRQQQCEQKKRNLQPNESTDESVSAKKIKLVLDEEEHMTRD